ncbi:hypothetical protein CFP56_018384, partial [Quercus suber]
LPNQNQNQTQTPFSFLFSLLSLFLFAHHRHHCRNPPQSVTIKASSPPPFRGRKTQWEIVRVLNNRILN